MPNREEFKMTLFLHVSYGIDTWKDWLNRTGSNKVYTYGTWIKI